MLAQSGPVNQDNKEQSLIQFFAHHAQMARMRRKASGAEDMVGFREQSTEEESR